MNIKVLSVILGLSFVVGCCAQQQPDSCIICSSATNITCATNPDSQMRHPCEGPGSPGCYTRIVDGHTLRGCTSELDEDVIANCHTDICFTCVGIGHQPVFGCNNNIFPGHRRQCHQCVGDLNSMCLEVPQQVAIPCEMFNAADQCFIQRTATTITRGCLSTRGMNCQRPEHCLICDGHGCNNAHGSSPSIPEAPSSSTTNKISIIMLSISFISSLAKLI